MKYQYITYIWPLIASTFVTGLLGIYSLLWQRNSKGSKSFILSMLLLTLWSTGNALEMAGTNLSIKQFWANMQYFAYCYSPVTLIALCMQFTGYDQWVRSKKILWLAVLPTIIILLVWTDGWHGLIRYDIQLDYSGSFPVIAKKYGPVFFIHTGYSYLLNLSAWVLLIRGVFFEKTIYKKQAIALLIGLSLIIIPNSMYVLGLSPVGRFDITPLFFGPAGLIIAWGIFRYKLFELIPLARATVIEIMEVGVLVLDLQDRILDVNPAFEKIVGFNDSKTSRKTVIDFCGKIPELAKAFMDRSITHKELSINLNGLSKDYEVLLSLLTDDKGTLIGRLAVIYDISEQKQAQQESLKHLRKLAVIEERENLARDMHDNLGQVLGFINLQAQGIRQELLNEGVEIAAVKLDKLVDATQSAHQEIRKYIRNARNLATKEMNFSNALIKEILEFENQTGLRIDFDIPKEFMGEEIELNIRLNLLNIVKETLTNIRKHAEAKQVKIVFLLAGGYLRGTIKDDGRGFDITQHNNESRTKFGLDIMRERASQIGAQIHIRSMVGQGTQIDFCVPLKKGEKKNADEVDVS